MHNNSREEYLYRNSSDLEGYPFWATHGLYGGGGYVVPLVGSGRMLKQRLAQVKADGWIDRYTRSIFIEFTVYNANVNLFGIVTILLERTSSGALFPYTRIEPVNLLGYKMSTMIFEIICQVVFLSFILFYIYHEIRTAIQLRWKYIYLFWSWLEMTIIFVSIAGTVIFFYRLIQTNILTTKFKASHGNEYMKFQYIGHWHELLLYMVGLVVFLANIKFLKLLRFNRRMSFLNATLQNCVHSLVMYGMMFAVMFFAYVQFFYLIYMPDLRNFNTFLAATSTCMQMLLGKFRWYDMQLASPVLGPIWFFG